MKTTSLIKTTVALLLCLLSYAALANAPISPPQKTVMTVSDNLRAALKAQHDAIEKNPKPVLAKIVKSVVLPHIDVDYMVKVVLGRQGHADWVKASKADQQAFVDQFVQLIVGTYSAALQQYNNQPVKVFPVRGYQSSATTAEVHSQLTRGNGQKVGLLYKLLKENGAWKITDFSVEGISLIQSYQAQFAAIVQSKGLAGLISTLKKHNESQK